MGKVKLENIMKYYIAKLSHDNGTSFLRTGAKDKETAINNIMAVELCPRCAIEIKNVPLSLYGMNAKHLFNKLKN